MNHDEFIHRISNSEEATVARKQPVLVALSGGADSVALLRALLEIGCDCRAAHCNFHLRDEESVRDELFVRELCQRLDAPLTVKDFDVAAWQQEHGGSLEMACRELRYTWFEQERVRQECRFIAVAHHANDQVETFFLNLLRGTGVKGLTGMERLNHHIWRPLLGFNRDDILDYLATIGQNYVNDSTNDKNDYRRNRLRNIILPIIGQQFPQAQQRILDTMDNLNRDHDLLTTLVNESLPDERHMDIKALCTNPHAATLLYHRIRHLGFNREQCVKIIEAASSQHAGKQFIGKGYMLVVNRHSIDIEKTISERETVIPIDLRNNVITPVQITVSTNNAPFSPFICNGTTKVAFNTRLLECKHIVLRHWRKGDRIKPYGMKGTKLVSDLFADLKLDHADKHNAWLLEADGDILWVLGYRCSAHFPVTEGSQDYLWLQI